SAEFLECGDAVGWFEPLYRAASGSDDEGTVPWADGAVNANLIPWLSTRDAPSDGLRALKIGCGSGDDCEELARVGYGVVGFDIAPTAIDWCHARFADSPVEYTVADLFDAPESWTHAFDFVLESFTLQALPPDARSRAIPHMARFVAPGGMLLVITRGRDADEDPGDFPWPVSRDELDGFVRAGLDVRVFEDYVDDDDPPKRRFRVEYTRPAGDYHKRS
ncbi:MAG: class I SAM-dependent methyltransferase, partial [Candidatus Poribacteria bacterium]